MRSRILREIKRAAISFIFLCAVFTFAAAQQPFVTDDADVTEKGKFHFEIANEFDRLQKSSLPIKYQNAARATLDYGLAKNLEISVTGQFLTLVSEDNPPVSGIGDANFAAKYNFLKERENSMRPALAVSAFLQIPTGSANRGLGSGVYDFGINGIAQKTFREKNTARLNVGTLFAGNTATGALGITVVRGQVFTGGFSYVRQIGDKLQLGGEVTGAVTSNFRLSRGQLQTQLGGNYQIGEKTTFDFGVIAGRFAASPRFGLLIGFSRDF